MISKNRYFILLANSLIGCVLIVSAILKSTTLATPPSSEFSTLNPALVLIELCLGIWVMLGVAGAGTRKILFVVFLIFCVANLRNIFSGRATCGCFGPIEVDPILSLAIDQLLIIFTIFSGRVWKPSTLNLLTVGFSLFLVSGLTYGFLGTGVSLFHSSERFEPREWSGRTLPFLDRIKGGGTLREGSWWVMIYRKDCASCHQALPNLLSSFHSFNDPKPLKLAIVELAPCSGDLGFTAIALPDDVLLVCLETGSSWFIETPQIFALQEGTVQPLPSGRH